MDVLVVEDDPKTAQWLRLYLERDGLAVTTTADGEAALRLVEAEMPRLLLVDVMVPGLDGFEVCRAVRSSSSTPVMLITARASEDDRLRGFEAGADDYITKPFSPREVVARVRAVLRRTQTDTPAPAALHVGAVTLRTDAMTLHAGGVPPVGDIVCRAWTYVDARTTRRACVRRHLRRHRTHDRRAHQERPPQT